MRSLSRVRAAVAALAIAAGAVTALAVPAAAAPVVPAAPAATQVPGAPVQPNAPELGENVYVFTPDTPQADIQATVDAIADQQFRAEFGPGRYALLFAPGTYGTPEAPLSIRVGYYTEIGGLGAAPGDVQINGTIGITNQCLVEGTGNCIALTNFWRSVSNVTINVAGGEGCRAGTNIWAVSQAAPMRGVDVNGPFSLMDYCGDGPWYASGGYISDSRFSTEVISGSQQQFLVTNSRLNGWSNGVWNQVFAGTPGAPPTSFGTPDAPYTTLPTTPVSMAEPRVVADGGGYAIHVPPVRRDASGVSWESGAPAGDRIPLSDVLVATPATPIAEINAALDGGRHLLLGPGVYSYDQPIRVTRADSLVLGLGLPTVIPTSGNTAFEVTGAGAVVSGVTVDAGPVESPVLVRAGTPGCACGGQDNPIVLQDLFVRIGGAAAGKADTSIVVDADHVLLDHIWAWRGDHGQGIGWDVNTADHGVVVNGADVTAIGLFVEHYQRTQTIWNGERGRVVLYQNELPYDPPNQAAWQESPDSPGYPAFEVAPGVTDFQGWGLGSYSYFNQNAGIETRMSFRVPQGPGIRLQSLLTVFLDGDGAIRSVVNDTGTRADVTNAGQAQNVVSYP